MAAIRPVATVDAATCLSLRKKSRVSTLLFSGQRLLTFLTLLLLFVEKLRFFTFLIRHLCGLRRRKARVQTAAATLSGNSLRQAVPTHRVSVHQATKLVAALLRVARVTAGLAESNGSLQPGL